MIILSTKVNGQRRERQDKNTASARNSMANRIIIDTDPGQDDALAFLVAPEINPGSTAW